MQTWINITEHTVINLYIYIYDLHNVKTELLNRQKYTRSGWSPPENRRVELVPFI